MKKVSNKEPLISVIVPVYNVENYLEKCVESIINQTYKNLEIILIDDGSTDSCPEICDKYIKEDKRIKVIHKKNGGLSDARNIGIKYSNGEYLTFVDSDDTISCDFIEYLYDLNVENNTKLAVAPYIIVARKKNIYCSSENKNMVFDTKEALRRMLFDDGFTVSACSKLYAKSLFDNIKFPKGKIFEDTATTYKTVLKCDKISYGYNGGYYYYKRENSILNSDFNSEQLLFIKFTDEMGSKILEKYPELSDAVESKRIDSRFSILRRMVMSDNLNHDNLKMKIDIEKYLLSKRKNIVFGNYNKKIKLAIILLSFGEKTFKIFWKLYTKFKYNM